MRIYWFVIQKLMRKIHAGKLCEVALLSCCKVNDYLSHASLNRMVHDVNLSKDDLMPDFCIEQYLSHKFNLLGSGWVCVNTQNAQDDTDLAHNKYQNINWQLDYKSGFIFNVNKLGHQILVSKRPDGVDIKAPWELARMYHLPQIALTAVSSAPEKSNRLLNEFKNQLNDFFINNPIGLGVNWACPMEVAIRAANILLAYDIFCLLPNANNDQILKSMIVDRMVEHGRFIILNLERSKSRKNNNHYLANLCGLLFISNYILSSETLGWKRYATREMLVEIDKQFLDDGGSAEGSTAYHRLSSEIIAYSLALMIRDGVSLPVKLQNKIKRIGNFMRFITTMTGDIIQIGDNDSGHLFRLSNRFTVPISNNSFTLGEQDHVCDINELWAGNTANLIESLFGAACPNNVELQILKCLSNNKALNIDNKRLKLHSLISNNKDADIIDWKYKIERKINLCRNINASQLEVIIMHDFGLARFQTNGFQLYIKLPPYSCYPLTAHIHDDVLHWEYYIDGEGYFKDPGSYTYTASSEERDKYRSRTAHNVPLHDVDFVTFKGLWEAAINYNGNIWDVDNTHISVLINSGDIVHERTIRITSSTIYISDKSNMPFKTDTQMQNIYSSGYGKLVKSCIVSNENK